MLGLFVRMFELGICAIFALYAVCKGGEPRCYLLCVVIACDIQRSHHTSSLVRQFSPAVALTQPRQDIRGLKSLPIFIHSRSIHALSIAFVKSCGFVFSALLSIKFGAVRRGTTVPVVVVCISLGLPKLRKCTFAYSVLHFTEGS